MFFANDFSLGGLIWFIYYVGIHALAIHYFLTAGNNPGFAKESDPDVVLQANQSNTIVDQTNSFDDDEEYIGFPIKQSDAQKRSGNSMLTK